MCPRLIHICPFTVYDYGLMLALGFIIGSYISVCDYCTGTLRLAEIHKAGSSIKGETKWII